MVGCRGDGADAGAGWSAHPATLGGKSFGAQTLSAWALQSRSALYSSLRTFFLPVFSSPGLPRWPRGVHLLDAADILVSLSDRRQALRAPEKGQGLSPQRVKPDLVYSP